MARQPVEPPAETEEPEATREEEVTPFSSPLSGKRIGIIGAGAMGGALCRGLVLAGAAPADLVVLYDPHLAHTQALQQQLGVKIAKTAVLIAKHCDIVLLCIKPLNIVPVLTEIRESLLREDKTKPLPLVISIAAGIRLATLEAHLPDNLPVIRAMPNTPARVGKGAAAYCPGTHVEQEHLDAADAIFSSVGVAVTVPESLMDAVTALSGSGPAYIYLVIEALVDGGVKVGLPRDIAYKLAAQTVLGSAQMVIETGLHPAQLRDMVTTPAGTTIAAISALEHSGLRAALIDAVEKAAQRAHELD